MPGATAASLSLLAICENAPLLDPVVGSGSSLISAHVLADLPADLRLTLAYFGDRTTAVDPRVLDRADHVVELPILPLALGKAAQPVTTLPSASWIRTRSRTCRIVRALGEAADVTYLHGPPTFALAPILPGPIVAHEVDPYVEHFSQLAQSHPGPKGLYWRLQARRFARIERSTARRAHTLVLVNPADADRLGAALGIGIEAIPNGVPAPLDPRATHEVDDRTVIFGGSLGYRPNLEAIDRLVHSVMPLVWAEVPECRLVLAGRRPGPGIADLASYRIEIRPDVPSLASEFRSAAVSCYPGTMGLGSKNSVRESLATGCPVVCSPESARGFTDPDVLMIASSDRDLATQVVALLRDPERREAAGERGRRSVGRLPTWLTVADRFGEIFRQAATAHVVGDAAPARGRE